MSQIPELAFGPGLQHPTLTGDKEITIRKYRAEAHRFQAGEYVLGLFKDGLAIVLQITADTEVITLADLPDSVAREDGFRDAAHAYDELKSYYPDLTLRDKVGIIRYQIPRIAGAPAVSAV